MCNRKTSFCLAVVLLAVVLLAGALPLRGQTVPPATPEEEGKLIAVLLSDTPLKAKMDACRQLAVIGTPKAVPVLAPLLEDEKLSHMARYALEPIPGASVDQTLRDAMGKLKGRLLVGVLGSIGVRHDAKAVPALMKMLDDPDPETARAAAGALGKIANAEAAGALREKLGSVPPKVRPAVADATLACAEALLAADKPGEAAALYESVTKAELPKHFRVAATYGLIQARQAAEKKK
ncbi:MAG: HEAT repeat domain-containing protein [Pirellulales bacterium]|nr:HEAT repeat domain-containing protein [Pirellulales bacterium]